MFLFTSGNFPDVSRVMAFRVRERGREEGPQALVGEGNKEQGHIRKQKSRIQNTAKRKRTFFLDRKGKKEAMRGGRKEEMPKWLSGFFIVSPRNTLRGTGSSAQRFL